MEDVRQALSVRIAFFDAHGCRSADHGLDYVMFRPASDMAATAALRKARAGEPLTREEAEGYQTALLLHCAREYARLGWVMQLHFSCMRNPNTKILKTLGPDTGFDCMAVTDSCSATYRLLDTLEQEASLPRTVLYSLNPADNAWIDTLLGAFQSPEIPGKIQHGSAWWFNDHKAGMTEHLTSLANLGVLGNFIGMLTDSRSLSFRWYGKSDPIPLEYIRQIPGMRSIVTAVYDVKPGEVWPEESLAGLKKDCEDNGLLFDVVESIPVHEDIKLGRGDVERLLEVYCENIRRCAKYGVKCVTYNFMPVFDWTRTQLDKKGADGSTSLVMYWDQMKGLDPLRDDIHLPGWDSSYTQEEVRELISAYGELGEEGLSHLRSAPHHHLRGQPGSGFEAH